jgi:hypothetical protein
MNRYATRSLGSRCCGLDFKRYDHILGAHGQINGQDEPRPKRYALTNLGHRSRDRRPENRRPPPLSRLAVPLREPKCGGRHRRISESRDLARYPPIYGVLHNWRGLVNICTRSTHQRWVRRFPTTAQCDTAAEIELRWWIADRTAVDLAHKRHGWLRTSTAQDPNPILGVGQRREESLRRCQSSRCGFAVLSLASSTVVAKIGNGERERVRERYGPWWVVQRVAALTGAWPVCASGSESSVRPRHARSSVARDKPDRVGPSDRDNEVVPTTAAAAWAKEAGRLTAGPPCQSGRVFGLVHAGKWLLGRIGCRRPN